MAQEAATGSFSNVEELPPDKIFLTKTEFLNDESNVKYNLGIGAYRTKEGKPLVLDIVHKAEKALANDLTLNKEYFPIGGDKTFIANAQKLILGNKNYETIKNTKGIAGAQGLSGTGSLRILLAFVKQSLSNNNNNNINVWISNPTWGNHKKIINHAGLSFKEYPYWDPNTKGLNFNGMIDTLQKNANKGDVILLQACAHNPTGVDPTQEQWKEICKLVQSKGLIPLFDSAYQGFATADLNRDAWAVQYFAEQGSEMMIAQSFSKNLGLYNERIGCATVVCESSKVATAIDTQLCAIIRPMYSNPPSHGARIVNFVLNDENNYDAWKQEMNGMSNQIRQARLQLRFLLENGNNDESKNNNDNNNDGSWKHITDQIGMFCFSGLTKDQVSRMKSKHHVYMLDTGRISMAGVAPSDYFNVTMDENGKLIKTNNDTANENNSVKGNVEYLANAINEVVEWAKKQ